MFVDVYLENGQELFTQILGNDLLLSFTQSLEGKKIAPTRPLIR